MTNLSNLSILRILSVLVASLAVLWAAYIVRNILLLALIAFFFAVGLEPLVQKISGLNWYGRKKSSKKKPRVSRGGSVTIVFAAALIFIGTFLASLLPTLISETTKLAREAPAYAQQLTEKSQNFKELDSSFGITDRLDTIQEDLPNLLGRSASTTLGILAGIGRTVFTLVTVLVFTIYFMLDLPPLLAGIQKLIPKTQRKRFAELSQIVRDRISGYLLGQLAVSVIASLVGLVFFLALGIPFALPLALWIAFSALIPMVGSSLGAVPAVIVAFFLSVPKGISVLVFFLLYQQVENYVLAPRVMKRAVNISPAGVLISALIGGTLLGIPGALLAIPVAASLKAIAHEVWIPRQDLA